MVSIILKNEILKGFLNKRIIILSVFSIILMPISAVMNYEFVESRKGIFDSEYSEYQQTDPNIYNRKAFRSPSTLAIISRGAEDYIPLYYTFDYRNDSVVSGRIKAEEFSIMYIFGGFDFLFVVNIVFTLLVVLLSFDSISGERENGILQAIIANPISRPSVIVGKFLGGIFIVLSSFSLGYLFFILTITYLDPAYLDSFHISRLIILYIISSLYITMYYSIGIMTSALCRSSKTSIVALLIIWVFLQLVIPKAGDLVASSLVNVRPVEELEAERNRIISDARDELATKAGNLYQQMTGKSDLRSAHSFFRSNTPEADRFYQRYQIVNHEVQSQKRASIASVENEYTIQKNHREILSYNIALISPSSAFSFLVIDIADTGRLSHKKFDESINSHYQLLNDNIFDRERSDSYRIRLGRSTIAGSFRKAEEVDFARIEHFQAPAISLRDIFSVNAWGISSILAYLFICFSISYVALIRYDVRYG